MEEKKKKEEERKGRKLQMGEREKKEKQMGVNIDIRWKQMS